MKIDRLILPDIRHHLEVRGITIFIGDRQVGKTTILKVLQSDWVS